MGGIALHGDLIHPLASTAVIPLAHRLESVKVLPPPGMPKTEERSTDQLSNPQLASRKLANRIGNVCFVWPL